MTQTPSSISRFKEHAQNQNVRAATATLLIPHLTAPKMRWSLCSMCLATGHRSRSP